MSGTRLNRERRLLVIAVVAAVALTLCVTPVGIRITGIYAYGCLLCGGAGAVVSDWVARLIHRNVTHVADWVGYVVSYTVFFVANAVFFFSLLWTLSATVDLICRLVRRKGAIPSRI
jgi:hypothetical protein